MVEPDPATDSDASLFAPTVDRTRPRHCRFEEADQWEVLVQTYTDAPPEITGRLRSFRGEVERIYLAAEQGRTHVLRRPGGPRRDPGEARSPESIERARWRAKKRLRRHVMELAPNDLLTLTTRRAYSHDTLWAAFKHFVRLVRQADPSFEYVAVPEPHKDRDHLHLHAAVRVKANHKILRRCWHIALEAVEGRRCTRALQGAEAPGNIDLRHPRGFPRRTEAEAIKSMRRIAKYVSKYITKDMVERFNRKRYVPSKGITVQAAKAFWLDSLDLLGAIREASRALGHGEDGPVFRMWLSPDGKRFWWAVDPEVRPPPPF